MLPENGCLVQLGDEEKDKKEREVEDTWMEVDEAARVDGLWHQWAQDHAYSKHMYKICTKESITALLNCIETNPPGTEEGLFLRPEVTVIGPSGYYSCGSQYENLHSLEHGGYGVVNKLRDKCSRRIIAKKEISKEKFRKIEAEILLHSSCKHIPELFGLNFVNGIVGIWMEFVEFTWDRIDRVRTEEAADFLGQLIDGLLYLHRQDIMHSDIKPQNLGLTSEKVVKILDFGSAKRVTDGHHGCGLTPEYMAPEYFLSPENINEKADIWAAALSLLFILTGRHPWTDGDATSKRFEKVQSRLRGVTAEFVLQQHSVNDVSQHQWLSRVLIYMLQIQPDKRCSASLASIFIGEKGNEAALSHNHLWQQYSCTINTRLQENTAAVRLTAERDVITHQLVRQVDCYQRMEHQILVQNSDYLENCTFFISAQQQQQQQPHFSHAPQQVPAAPLLVEPILLQRRMQELVNQMAAAQQAQNARLPANPNRDAPIPDFTELIADDSSDSMNN